jgi:hypothetical protein
MRHHRGFAGDFPRNPQEGIDIEFFGPGTASISAASVIIHQRITASKEEEFANPVKMSHLAFFGARPAHPMRKSPFKGTSDALLTIVTSC